MLITFKEWVRRKIPTLQDSVWRFERAEIVADGYDPTYGYFIFSLPPDFHVPGEDDFLRIKVFFFNTLQDAFPDFLEDVHNDLLVELENRSFKVTKNITTVLPPTGVERGPVHGVLWDNPLLKAKVSSLMSVLEQSFRVPHVRELKQRYLCFQT